MRARAPLRTLTLWATGGGGPALLLLVVLLLATAATTVFVRANVTEDAREGMRRDAAAARRAIDDRIAAYTEILLGIKGHFEASDNVTHAEFQRFVGSLAVEERYPGVQVLAFAPGVRRFERERFSARVRRQVARSGIPYPRFRVHPPGNRARYVPVAYLEPVQGNEQAFGFDLLTGRARRDAVERTQHTGRPAATAPIRLVQEAGAQRGFLLMVAVRNRSASLADPTTLRFQGVVSAAFRMGDLLAGLLPREGEDFDLEIYDVGSGDARAPARPSTRNIAYDLDGSPDAPGRVDPDRASLTSLEVAGRRWAIYYERLADAGTAASAPWLVGGGGLLLSVLTALLVFSLARTRSRALGMAEEITRDLERSRAELARSNAELEQFAYVASHDLSEPLRTVSGFVQLLQRRYGGELDEDADRFIDYTVQGVERMQALIDGLLAYSRLGTGRVKPADVDLGRLADEAIQALAASIADGGAEVVHGPLPVVRGDQTQLLQLLLNLISNALKFAHHARPARVELSATREEDAWRISVADNGIGIGPEHAERVFRIFQRLHGPDAYPGVGIGLALCRAIVERHGGRIWVEPREGGGTVVHFTIVDEAAAPRASRA